MSTPTSKKNPKRCKCIATINKYLKANHNAELANTDFVFRVKTRTMQLDEVFVYTLRKLSPRRKPLPMVVMAFCPCCGRKQLPDEPKSKEKTCRNPSTSAGLKTSASGPRRRKKGS